MICLKDLRPLLLTSRQAVISVGTLESQVWQKKSKPKSSDEQSRLMVQEATTTYLTTMNQCMLQARIAEVDFAIDSP